jgi:hypothetical protein
MFSADRGGGTAGLQALWHPLMDLLGTVLGLRCGRPIEPRRPNRNGGRHCCQPPLRRAKDLPPFATKPRGPACQFWLTSSGVASHQQRPLARSSTSLPQCAGRSLASVSGVKPDPKVKTSRCFTALLGMICSRPALLPHVPENAELPRRASGRSSLPAPLPACLGKFPKKPANCLPQRSDLWSPAAPSCRFRLPGEAGTAVPIT